MTIRIGANPIGWSNDDMPELGGETPLEACLAEAKEAGFEGMELGNKFPREPAALKKALAPFGLACVSGWYSAELLTARRRRRRWRRCGRISTCSRRWARTCWSSPRPRTPIHGDRSKPLSQRPVLKSGDWAEFGARVTRGRRADARARACASSTTTTWAPIVQSEADIDAFMDATGDAVHLLLDTGHATWGGADPGGARRALPRPHQPRPHQGRAPGGDGAGEGRGLELPRSVIAGVYTVPGDGMVDFAVGVPGTARLYRLGRGRGRAGSRRRLIRSPMPRWATPISSGSCGSRAALARTRDVEAPRQTKRAGSRTAASIHVTPASAGWTYVGFDVYRLDGRAGRARSETGDREACLVMLVGQGRASSAAGSDFGVIGGRASPFEPDPWSVYVPARSDWSRRRRRPIASSRSARRPATASSPPRVIRPDEVGQETRGKGTNTRHVRNILPETEPAESLLVVEVITPAGHWSSYPPHKHDRDALPDESSLEETYYHRLNPPQGFAAPAGLHGRPLARRDHGGRATATWCWCRAAIIPVGAAARLRPLLSQRDGRPEAGLEVPQRPGPRMAAFGRAVIAADPELPAPAPPRADHKESL